MMLPLAYYSSFLINVAAGYNGQMNFKFLPMLRFYGWYNVTAVIFLNHVLSTIKGTITIYSNCGHRPYFIS